MTQDIAKTGEKAGRKPRWSDPVALQRAVDDYFKFCFDHEEPALITGLAHALGFASRKGLFEAVKRDDECSEVLRRAKLYVEMQREKELLTRDKVTGQIFHLKVNAGWTEPAQDVNVNNPDGNLGTKLITVLPASPKSMEEWEGWYAQMQQRDPEAIDVTPEDEGEAAAEKWELP